MVTVTPDVGTGTGEEVVINNVTVWMDILVIRMVDYVSQVNIFITLWAKFEDGVFFASTSEFSHIITVELKPQYKTI